jgi:RNA polymerase sigma-70 factor (ECF subfamily)
VQTIGGPIVPHTWVHAFQFRSFDQQYVDDLRAGVPEVSQHFAAYFGELIRIKLRGRLRCPHLIEDVRQETLFRVLRVINERGIEHPERLGAFVNSVCTNVTHEFLRAASHSSQDPDNAREPADDRPDARTALIQEELRREVKMAIEQLSLKDRQLLRMIFFEERDKTEICETLGVTRDSLRVLLHRAKLRLKDRIRKAEHRAAEPRRGARFQAMSAGIAFS